MPVKILNSDIRELFGLEGDYSQVNRGKHEGINVQPPLPYVMLFWCPTMDFVDFFGHTFAIHWGRGVGISPALHFCYKHRPATSVYGHVNNSLQRLSGTMKSTHLCYTIKS